MPQLRRRERRSKTFATLHTGLCNGNPQREWVGSLPGQAGCARARWNRSVLAGLPPLTDFVFNRKANARLGREASVQCESVRFHGCQKIAAGPQKPPYEQLGEFAHAQYFHLGRMNQPVKEI